MHSTVAVAGATGRMGRFVTSVIRDAADFELGGHLTSRSGIGELAGADIIIDVSTPSASPAIVDYAVGNGIPIVVGTSGWSAERISYLSARMSDDAESGVLIVPNFAIGAVLAAAFATEAARHYASVEIIETHHDDKVDSPSGTALRTAEGIGAVRRAHGLAAASGADQHARGQFVAGVPVHSLRMRGVLATQDVVLTADSERFTIRHEAHSHEAYGPGILLALRSVPNVRGVVVGLDALMGLATGESP